MAMDWLPWYWIFDSMVARFAIEPDGKNGMDALKAALPSVLSLSSYQKN